MQTIMRDICQKDLFRNDLYDGYQIFYNKFSSHRHMIKERPRIRFDGLYINKMHYVRKGLNY